MKKYRLAIFLVAIIISLPLFYVNAAAATENSVSSVVTPARDMDFSSDISRAPFLVLKADMDVAQGAVFVLSLTPGVKWTYDDGNISTYFSGSGGNYTSTSRLSDEPSFSFDARIITDTDLQITTKNPLPKDKYMLIPLIVRLDGSAEASVSVLYGDAMGITSGTYVFANPGRVNEAKIEVSASSKTSGNVITGNVTIAFSAGLGDRGIELILPAGFNFDNDFKKNIEVEGEGGYSASKIDELSLNSSRTTLYLKTQGSKLSTTSSRLRINNIKVNALENAAQGDITMSFSGFDTSQRFKFGEYTPVEEEPAKEVEEKQEEKPAEEKLEINAQATSGVKQVIVNGKSIELDTAPFNDQNGRLMVPLRFIANAFGVGDDNINWDADSKKATVVFSAPGVEKEIVFTIGSSVYTVDGEEKTMDTTAEIKDGYTFVPVRYAADAFGISVNYIPETKTAEFTGVFE